MDAVRSTLLGYLQDHTVSTIATCGPDGPWGAAVYYVSEGYTLYFLSSPSSRHITNLSHTPRVAVTIQEDHGDWRQIRGVQLEGVAGEISGDEEVRVKALYGRKFPQLGLASQAPPAVIRALARVRWYRIRPHRLFFIDNSRGLGSREEVEVPPAERGDIFV